MKRQTIQTTIEVITPDDAKRYLAMRPPNQRPISRDFVLKYADVMSRGGWELTHQGIAFDADGRLIDGQHRMAAVLKSGATAEFMVFRYREVGNSMLVIDSGKARSVADKLVILGLVEELKKNGAKTNQAMARDLGAVINMYAMLVGGFHGRRNALDGDMLEKIATEEKDVAWAMGLNRTLWGTLGLAALAFCRACGTAKVEELVFDIENNVDTKSDAIKHIREGLLSGDLRPAKTHTNGTWRHILAVRWVYLILSYVDGGQVVLFDKGDDTLQSSLEPLRARRVRSLMK
jgi:hypothetical protein